MNDHSIFIRSTPATSHIVEQFCEICLSLTFGTVLITGLACVKHLPIKAALVFPTE